MNSKLIVAGVPLLVCTFVGLLEFVKTYNSEKTWVVAVVRSWQGAALIGVLLALLILALGGDLADFFEVEKVPESRTKKSKAKAQRRENEPSGSTADAGSTDDSARQPHASADAKRNSAFSHDRPRQPYASAETARGAGSSSHDRPRQPYASASSGNSASGSADRPRQPQTSTASGSQARNHQKGSGESKPQPAPRVAQSPRTVARELVGTKLNPAQAVKAAEKVVAIQPFMHGQRVASLNELWGFFDMQPPSGGIFDPQDEPIQTLKSKLNRQRLLFHPDKNEHPEAEPIFKYLEQCHQRLTSAFVRRSGQRAEGVHQRTRREEEEFRAEQERRQKQEAERQAKAEEEERLAQEEMRKAEAERQRLESMRLHKMRRAEDLARKNRPDLGLFGSTCSGGRRSLDHEIDLGPPTSGSSSFVGSLQVKLLRARDLPPQPFLLETNSYAVVKVGNQQQRTPKLPGCSPSWQSSFAFDIKRIDTGLLIEVYRESLGWGLFPDELVGTIEIPFLDLEEWSGHTIGRMLQAAGPLAPPEGQPTLVELRASFQWF